MAGCSPASFPKAHGLGGTIASVARVARHWEAAGVLACARRGEVDRVSAVRGSLGPDSATAPMAIYRAQSVLDGRVLVLIQHGSYQLVRESDQPLLASGELMLYRGLQRSREFRHFQPGALGEGKSSSWRHFTGVQAHVLSDSVRSFNSVHDRTSRCETEHIADRGAGANAAAAPR